MKRLISIVLIVTLLTFTSLCVCADGSASSINDPMKTHAVQKTRIGIEFGNVSCEIIGRKETAEIKAEIELYRIDGIVYRSVRSWEASGTNVLAFSCDVDMIEGETYYLEVVYTVKTDKFPESGSFTQTCKVSGNNTECLPEEETA